MSSGGFAARAQSAADRAANQSLDAAQRGGTHGASHGSRDHEASYTSQAAGHKQ